MTETARAEARRRLGQGGTAARAGIAGTPLGEQITASGIAFAAVGGPIEDRWHRALAELAQCIRPIGGTTVLNEGGVYDGCWLESTGTINTDVLARFAPDIATDTLLQFAELQREDGMLPYKVTPDGPGFSQIQIVTPLARVVWRHHQRTGDDALLRTMYDAMVRYDAWLARYRDTRGSGGVEAFCAFDTGHDLSPRFWFAPDRAFHADARRVDPGSATVPYIAPDLTANVACQRSYLAVIAEALGEDPRPWRDAAQRSLDALFAQCFDDEDALFYDRDRSGDPVRIASDVLLRVLACEVGDAEFFAASLRRYLMHTGKFLAHYGFTTIAMDDPRFDHDASRNSWAGPVNFLAQLRAPDAFEQHGHVAELALTAQPTLAALAVADAFPQCLDPWSGAAGFTEVYSPSILWFLDALERHSGILPHHDGTVWFSGLTPTRLEHGAAAEAIACARAIGGADWELAGDDEIVEVHRDGAFAFSFPRGWRVQTDAAGDVVAVIGLAAQPVEGELAIAGAPEGLALRVAPNERIALSGGTLSAREVRPFVSPVF